MHTKLKKLAINIDFDPLLLLNVLVPSGLAQPVEC